MLLVEWRGEQQADVALGEQIVGLLALAGREIGDLGDVEAKGMGVEICRLLGVAHVKANVIDIDEAERIGIVRGQSACAGGGLGHVSTPDFLGGVSASG